METTVVMKYVADKEYTATNASGNTVNIDMYGAEDKKAQSPMELLLSALASCAAVDLVSMIKKRRKELVDLTAEVVGTRRDEVPKYYTNIHVKYEVTSPDASEEEIGKLVALATEKYCSVASTLNGTAEITHSFTLKR